MGELCSFSILESWEAPESALRYSACDPSLLCLARHGGRRDIGSSVSSRVDVSKDNFHVIHNTQTHRMTDRRSDRLLLRVGRRKTYLWVKVRLGGRLPSYYFYACNDLSLLYEAYDFSSAAILLV